MTKPSQKIKKIGALISLESESMISNIGKYVTYLFKIKLYKGV